MRNLKADIKVAVTNAIERLYQPVKEAEAEKGKDESSLKIMVQNEARESKEVKNTKEEELMKRLEEYAMLLRKNEAKMEKLKEVVERQMESLENITYLSVTAGETKRVSPQPAALHSIVVSSKNEIDTEEEVLAQIREILGCSSVEKREKVNERLKVASDRLNGEGKR